MPRLWGVNAVEMKDAKRVEVIIEAPVERRLTDALESAGVTGYTVLPVLGGSGRSGRQTIHRSPYIRSLAWITI